MAKIVNTGEKAKMLLGIREESQGFRKVLDSANGALADIAKRVKYEGTDTIVNASAGLSETIAENLENVDQTLNEMAELYLKQGVISDAFQQQLTKFMNDKQDLKVEYETVKSPEGEENYDSTVDGAAVVEEIQKIASARQSYMETVFKLYKGSAGEDIAELIVPAFKKLEESCNNYVSELKSVIDAQAKVDEKLNAISNGIGDLSANVRMSDAAEGKTKKFGKVQSSRYLDV